MRPTRQILVGLLVATSIGGIAVANAAGPQPWGDAPIGKMARHVAMNVDPAERVKQRLDYQKYQLKITPEQEALWNAYAEKVVVEAGKGMAQMRALATNDKLTAPERLAQREKLMEERLAAMKAVHESFNRLYAALTPEQKATADQQAARMGRGGMGGHRGHFMPPRS